MRFNRVGTWAAVAAMALAATAAGCGGDDEDSTTAAPAATSAAAPAESSAAAPAESSAAAPAESSAEAPAESSAEAPAESSAEAPAESSANEPRIKLGIVTHVKGNPFIESIIQAAQDAADDLNVELVTGGTTEFDADQQLKVIGDMFASGVQGVATSVPGDSMAVGLNDFIGEGKPIVQFNVFSAKVEGMYVGEKTLGGWTLLGQKLGEKAGGAAATGSALVGTCFPGLGVLEARGRGVIAGIKETAPNLKIVGPFDVKVDSVVNYTNWKQQAAANPDAVILAGLCAPDLESLGKVNAENGDKYVTGGSDPTEGNLTAIKEGHGFMTVGQTGYVQGYLPIKMMADAIRKGIKLEKGFIPAGAEFITAEGSEEPFGLPPLSLDELITLATDKAKTKEYYAPLFAAGGQFDDWASKIEPTENAEN